MNVTTGCVPDRWYLGDWMCEAWLSIDYCASTASIFNLFVLSLDRYWSITSPLKYLRRRTKRRAFLMIAAAWALSLLWILPVTGWSTLAGEKEEPPDHHHQTASPPDHCETDFADNIAFKVSHPPDPYCPALFVSSSARLVSPPLDPLSTYWALSTGSQGGIFFFYYVMARRPASLYSNLSVRHARGCLYVVGIINAKRGRNGRKKKLITGFQTVEDDEGSRALRCRPRRHPFLFRLID